MAHAEQGTPAPPTHPSRRLPVEGKPHLYVLCTRDRSRVKIGRTQDPVRRIAELVRLYPDIDLAHSVLIRLDMFALEDVLHAVFALVRIPLPDRRPGFTEWFRGDLTDPVMDLCRHIARHRGQTYSAVRGLHFLLVPVNPVSPPQGAVSPARDSLALPLSLHRPCRQAPPRTARPASRKPQRTAGGRRGRKH